MHKSEDKELDRVIHADDANKQSAVNLDAQITTQPVFRSVRVCVMSAADWDLWNVIEVL